MLRRTLVITLSLAVLALPGVESASSLVHFALSGSAPEADSEVQSPSEIRLWFTEVPEDGTMSIRLVTSSGDVLKTGEVVQDAEDGRVFSVTVPDALGAGAYTVAWRALGADGHVVRGTFSFSVSAQ